MPYPQDLVGKYINNTICSRGAPASSLTNSFVNGVLPDQTDTVMTAVYADSPNRRQGIHSGINIVNTNIPWNFTFLKYCPGAVTTARLAGPVITGPMSGCYLCTYTQGGPKVAHIGTTETGDNDAVKTAWLAFVARPNVSMVKGGSPADYFDFAEILKVKLPNTPPPQIFGYFAGGSAYAILMVSLPMNLNPPGLNLLQVASVKTMTMQPWSSIAAMRRFRL